MILTKHSEKGKIIATIKILMVARSWKGDGLAGEAQRIWGTVKLLCTILKMTTCHHSFVQSLQMRSTKSEPQCELWTLGNYDVFIWGHLVTSRPRW